MLRDVINDEYLEWLINLVCDNKFEKSISFRRLLTYLHSVEFVYVLPRDSSRAEDGVYLRYRFPHATNRDIDKYLTGPCSVLEMMVALAIRCEEEIMDNLKRGDRTGQWFWGMITNLGLGAMTDDRFDLPFVEDVITTFLNREYRSDGKGGLFTVRDCEYDLRTVEIWFQLCWYLDNIV